MSWPSNLHPSQLNQQQPTQPRSQQPSQQQLTSTVGRHAANTLTCPAHSTTTSQSPSPSMDLSLPATPSTVPFSSSADEHAYIATLLQHAHSSLAQQKPMEALGFVLAAVRQQRGEEGVFDVLNDTRQQFGLKPHANPIRQQRHMLQQQQLSEAAGESTDDVDMRMAALSLQSAEAVLLHGRGQGRGDERLQQQVVSGGSGGSGSGGWDDTDMADDSDGEEEYTGEEYEEGEASILEETGNGELLDEAMRAGTHVTCRACGGVIARSRMDAHVQLWCEANDHPSRGDG